MKTVKTQELFTRPFIIVLWLKSNTVFYLWMMSNIKIEGTRFSVVTWKRALFNAFFAFLCTSQWFIQSQGDAIKLNFSTRQLNPTWVVCKLNLLEPYSLHSKGGSALATYFCHSDRNSQMHVEQKLNFFKVHLTSSTWHEEWILFRNFYFFATKSK